MLRVMVVLLLAANLAFFAWMHGWLTPVVGIDPAGDHEPQRLKAQVRPEAIKPLDPPASAPLPRSVAVAAAPAPSVAPATVVTNPVASVAERVAAPASAAAAPVCLEAGPFAAADVPQLETVLRDTLPAGTWTLAARERPAQWLAYLGRFADADALRVRADELRDQNVRFEELRGGPPELEPGLALGRFEREIDARDALRRLTQQGVRGLRIVAVGAPVNPTYRLRIEQADGVLVAMTLRLKDRLLGKSLAPCGAVEALRG